MLKAKSKVMRIGNSIGLIIPNLVLTDSTFPFRLGDNIIVTLKKDKLTITKDK